MCFHITLVNVRYWPPYDSVLYKFQDKYIASVSWTLLWRILSINDFQLLDLFLTLIHHV